MVSRANESSTFHETLNGKRVSDDFFVDDARDNLGSDRQLAVYDSSFDETIIENYQKYDSFGNITREETPAVDHIFGYTGRERDEETGLHFYRARYFDSVVGRFMSEDPIGFESDDANLFRYVTNNAPNSTDPSGKYAVLFYGYFGLLMKGAENVGTEPCKLYRGWALDSPHHKVQWQARNLVVDEIVKATTDSNGKQTEPIILIGHSAGGVAAMQVAWQLQKKNLNVDLLVTLDPVDDLDFLEVINGANDILRGVKEATKEQRQFADNLMKDFGNYYGQLTGEAKAAFDKALTPITDKIGQLDEKLLNLREKGRLLTNKFNDIRQAISKTSSIEETLDRRSRTLTYTSPIEGSNEEKITIPVFRIPDNVKMAWNYFQRFDPLLKGGYVKSNKIAVDNRAWKPNVQTFTPHIAIDDDDRIAKRIQARIAELYEHNDYKK